MDLNSEAGRLTMFIGYFLFIGFVGGALLLGVKGWEQYRYGLSSMNPLSCVLTATVVLLVLAAIVATF